MKRFMRGLVLFLSVVIASTVMAKDLTFEWDGNIETDMAGYTLYERSGSGSYNYTSPIITSKSTSPTDGRMNCTIVDGGCYVNEIEKTNVVDYTLNAPDGAITTYHFVARAFDTAGLYSGDSNEIAYTIDLAPIVAATNFAGVYNPVTQTVDFVWSHSDSERVARWGLFKSSTSGSGYVNVTYIENTPPVLSTSYELSYEPGTTSYWVLVAYTAEGKYSPNSNELRIKLGPQNVHNLKVKVKGM